MHHFWKSQTAGVQFRPQLQQKQRKVKGSFAIPPKATSTFHLHTRFTHCLQDFVPFTLSYLQPLSHVL